MRRSWTTAVVAVVSFFAVMLGAPAHAQTLLLDHGHVDAFNVIADPDTGGLNMLLKEDVTGHSVLRNPEDVILGVKQSAYSDAIASTDIGEAGYLLPLTQQSDLLWPGWDTIEAGTAGYGRIDIVFDSVAGPGRVYLFTQTGFGGGLTPLLADGSLQLVSGSVRVQDPPAHTHAYWLFTEPGTYTMQVHAQGDNGSGMTSTPVRTYTWEVGDSAAVTTPGTGDADNDGGSDATVPGDGTQPGGSDTGSAPGVIVQAPGNTTNPGTQPGGTPGTNPGNTAGSVQPPHAQPKPPAQTQPKPPAQTQPGDQNKRKLANTGSSNLLLPIIVAALGLLALGAALVHMTVSGAFAHR